MLVKADYSQANIYFNVLYIRLILGFFYKCYSVRINQA